MKKILLLAALALAAYLYKKRKATPAAPVTGGPSAPGAMDYNNSGGGA